MGMKNKYPNRKSIRLASWNYAWQGFYFITICTKNMVHIFGEMQDGIMKLNSFGEIALREWIKTSEIRDNVILDEFVIMPNHMHGIIRIIDKGQNHYLMKANHLGNDIVRANRLENDIVRAYRDTPVLPNRDMPTLPKSDLQAPGESNLLARSKRNPPHSNKLEPNNPNGNQINNKFEKRSFRSPSKDLGAIIRGYKAAVTTNINKSRKVKGVPVWHRNYYEHIIRNEQSLNHIRFYIKSNPKKWDEDRFSSIT